MLGFITHNPRFYPLTTNTYSIGPHRQHLLSRRLGALSHDQFLGSMSSLAPQMSQVSPGCKWHSPHGSFPIRLFFSCGISGPFPFHPPTGAARRASIRATSCATEAVSNGKVEAMQSRASRSNFRIVSGWALSVMACSINIASRWGELPSDHRFGLCSVAASVVRLGSAMSTPWAVQHRTSGGKSAIAASKVTGSLLPRRGWTGGVSFCDNFCANIKVTQHCFPVRSPRKRPCRVRLNRHHHKPLCGLRGEMGGYAVL